MSKKKITTQDLITGLMNSYKRWKDIFDNGCQDPTYEDGVNINLVRNHIFYYKKKIEEELQSNFIAYPDVYFYPEPVELPNEFMAVDRYLPCLRKHLTANKNISYNEAIRFNFSEVL